MGTPRPHVSRHVSGRAPRRGRRPRQPAPTHRQIPAHFRLTLCRGRRPRRPVRFSSMSPTGRVPRAPARLTFGRSPKSGQKRCLKPQVSRLPARLTMSKNMAAYPAKAKIYADRRTTNRLRSSYRCRSYVPRGGTLFHGGRIRHFPAVRGSGSGDRGRSDSAWAFLRRGCDRTKGIPKTIGFWRRSFPHFFRCWKKWGRRRQKKRLRRGAATPHPSRLRRATCLPAGRSVRGSDTPPACHSIPRTPQGEGFGRCAT